MPRLYVPWIVVIVLEVGITGSVPFWSGMGSFSARYLLSLTPLVGMGLVTLFCAVTIPVRRCLVAACAVCCLFTGLFAIQYRMDLVPTAVPLNFTELVTDKFRLPEVRKRKLAVAQARDLLKRGDAEAAIRVLEPTVAYGEDREVDQVLEESYRAIGKPAEADAVDARRKQFVGTSFFPASRWRPEGRDSEHLGGEN